MKEAIPSEDMVVKLYKNDPTLALDMLNACLAEGKTEEFLLVLLHVVKAFSSIREVAEAEGIQEKALYETLSAIGNQNLKTLISVADAIGMRIAFVPKEQKM